MDATESEILQDDYEHIDKHVFYTPVNIPGPGIDADVIFAEQFQGCRCSASCVDPSVCGCVRTQPFYYSLDGRKLANPDHPPDMVYECHFHCQCDVQCANRLVQKGPHLKLELMKAGVKGNGLRCQIDLPKGAFVCEYAGEVIGAEEARRRYQRNLDGPNYIFALREHFGRINSNSVITYIDPTHIGNIGRYINHSCDPNLLVLPVRTDTVVPKLCLFARRDIPAGEELSFDYGGGLEPIQGVPDDWNRAKTCQCMAPLCRRVLPFDYSLG